MLVSKPEYARPKETAQLFRKNRVAEGQLALLFGGELFVSGERY